MTPLERQLSYLITGVLLAAFLTGRIVIASGTKILVGYDTFSYSYRIDPAFDRGPLVSFTGHAPRLWGTPLFDIMFPNDQARAIGQWEIGTIAWIALGLVVGSCLRHLAARVVALGTILTLGLTPQVASWDFTILAESLSINLGLLAVACLIHWLRTRSTVALILLTAVAFWWTFVRPEIGLFTSFVFLALAAVGWRRRQWLALGAAGMLAVSMLWVTAISPAMSRTFSGWGGTHLSLDEETFTFRMRYDILANPGVRSVYVKKLGMPTCPTVDQAEKTEKSSADGFGDAYRTCPALRAWAQRNAKSSGYRFVLAAPRLYLHDTRLALPESLRGGALTKTPHVLPDSVTNAFFPPIDRDVPILFGGLGLALALALAAGAWRRQRMLLITTVGIAVACVVSTLVGMMYTAGQLYRFGIQEAIGLRLAVLIFAAIAIDVGIDRLRRTDRESPQAVMTSPVTR